MNSEKIQVVKADITTLEVDVIVNAANESLLGGGGVDGAMHRAAGPGLLAECRKLGGCPTGQAKITKGYNLPSHYVIHTPGPVWHGGNHNERELLAGCYRNSLELVYGNGLKSVAFSAISTGIYGFPADEAAKIAVREVKTFLENHELPKLVIFTCFSDASVLSYQNALK